MVRDQVAPSFIALRDRLVSQRDTALADVKHTGSLLGRLGRLASFVIAFVLPTVAVVVYRQITRRSRESISLATALARERGQTRRRRRMLALQLSNLQRDLADIQAGTGNYSLAAARLGWDVEALVTVVDEGRRLTFEDVDLAAELADLGDALRSAGIDTHVAPADGTAWADPASLAAALRCLVLEAEEAGAGQIELGTSTDGGRVHIRVVHDGAALPSSVASLVFEMSHDDERAAVEGGAAPIRLLAAQELIEAMGGSLRPLPGPGRPGFLADLPHAGEQPSLGSGRRRDAAPVPA